MQRPGINCRSTAPRLQPPCNGRFLLLMAVLVFSLSSLAFSSVVAVGSCTKYQSYPTIQQAVNSVTFGSTVYVCPGTYYEQVHITYINLNLVGLSADGAQGATASGANNPVILPPSGGLVANATDLSNGNPIAAQIIAVTPSSYSTPIVVNISNITVDGSNNGISCAPNVVGIYYQNASGTIDHVVTRYQESTPLSGCQSGMGIFAQSVTGGSLIPTLTIEDSSVHDYNKNGITVDGSATATVSGNYVVGSGATSVIAQNGIQMSDGASGKVTLNTVTDDVYINQPNCTGDGANNTPICYSASGIILYNTGATSARPSTVMDNTVSNTQGGIVAYGDSSGTADYNTVTANKVAASQLAGPFQIDGIDLCSNNNTATSNTVFNSTGAGIHIDSSCTESTGPSGNNTTVTTATVNEACAGILTGNGTGNSVSGVLTYNVVATSAAGDSCPTGTSSHFTTRATPSPAR